MTDRIYLVTGDDSLKPMEVTPYANEDLLQRLLEQYPDLLAGEQVDPEDPRRWLLVQREAGISHAGEERHNWRLDHLFLDQDGVPTLVETKIASNPELRRQVVGQMLDYASNIIETWSAERIQHEFESRCEESGRLPEEVLDEHLGRDGVDSEDSSQSFWMNVKTNLSAGRIRLVFVADQVPSSLLRIVEFLNGQMDPCEVLAVELRQYLHQEGSNTIRTLVPRVHGLTATARHRKQVTRQVNDPGIYILEPIADEFEARFGLTPRRRMHRRGWIRMDHPGGPGNEEWLIYQSRNDQTVSICLDGGSHPLDPTRLQDVATALESHQLPDGVSILSDKNGTGAPFVRIAIADFNFADDSNWDELRSTLRQSMRVFLEAVEVTKAIT